ncbi:cell division protein ZipA [Vibrio sinensis]|uniref:Cell division protein ZipA n=1 Tax=Vibrio sinensis TaxID=2302434 RepID=A0A3A6QFP9_9VIBR|nr:cell division protein ZipA [Vibrio sinensis]RJX71658.1 cell division protein ZipA [Vibrio sinensis]
MQELRFVLIIVGALAIAALLFHGLWTSKKEGKSKFGDKPLGKLDVENDDVLESVPERGFAPEDDYEIIRKERKEPEFSVNRPSADPLVDSYDDVVSEARTVVPEAEPLSDIPSIKVSKDDVEPLQSNITHELNTAHEPMATVEVVEETVIEPINEPVIATEPEPEPEPELQVIVFNVHCAGKEPFIGTTLFDSMQQNGLLYGDMDIFHRHADLSGTGKVLFSVANMMQPGTLQHDDPADFSTKGISFFMTLPCFGDPEQNFKLMLKTAQQIADDMGGNVLDDGRNLMSSNRLDAYRAQIRAFKAAQTV